MNEDEKRRAAFEARRQAMLHAMRQGLPIPNMTQEMCGVADLRPVVLTAGQLRELLEAVLLQQRASILAGVGSAGLVGSVPSAGSVRAVAAEYVAVVLGSQAAIGRVA